MADSNRSSEATCRLILDRDRSRSRCGSKSFRFRKDPTQFRIGAQSSSSAHRRRTCHTAMVSACNWPTSESFACWQLCRCRSSCRRPQHDFRLRLLEERRLDPRARERSWSNVHSCRTANQRTSNERRSKESGSDGPAIHPGRNLRSFSVVGRQCNQSAPA